MYSPRGRAEPADEGPRAYLRNLRQRKWGTWLDLILLVLFAALGAAGIVFVVARGVTVNNYEVLNWAVVTWLWPFLSVSTSNLDPTLTIALSWTVLFLAFFFAGVLATFVPGLRPAGPSVFLRELTRVPELAPKPEPAPTEAAEITPASEIVEASVEAEAGIEPVAAQSTQADLDNKSDLAAEQTALPSEDVAAPVATTTATVGESTLGAPDASIEENKPDATLEGTDPSSFSTRTGTKPRMKATMRGKHVELYGAGPYSSSCRWRYRLAASGPRYHSYRAKQV